MNPTTRCNTHSSIIEQMRENFGAPQQAPVVQQDEPVEVEVEEQKLPAFKPKDVPALSYTVVQDLTRTVLAPGAATLALHRLLYFIVGKGERRLHIEGGISGLLDEMEAKNTGSSRKAMHAALDALKAAGLIQYEVLCGKDLRIEADDRLLPDYLYSQKTSTRTGRDARRLVPLCPEIEMHGSRCTWPSQRTLTMLVFAKCRTQPQRFGGWLTRHEYKAEMEFTAIIPYETAWKQMARQAGIENEASLQDILSFWEENEVIFPVDGEKDAWMVGEFYSPERTFISMAGDIFVKRSKRSRARSSRARSCVR